MLLESEIMFTEYKHTIIMMIRKQAAFTQVTLHYYVRYPKGANKL